MNAFKWAISVLVVIIGSCHIMGEFWPEILGVVSLALIVYEYWDYRRFDDFDKMFREEGYVKPEDYFLLRFGSPFVMVLAYITGIPAFIWFASITFGLLRGG